MPDLLTRLVTEGKVIQREGVGQLGASSFSGVVVDYDPRQTLRIDAH